MDTNALAPVEPTPSFATAGASIGEGAMAMRRPLPERLLGVWAHPDDEAYRSAGLMARVVDAGGAVTIATVTSGERGTDDPNLSEPTSSRRTGARN